MRAGYERKLGGETRTVTVRRGRKLAEVATAAGPAPQLGLWLGRVRNGVTPGTYPVGLGVLFTDLGSPEEDAFAVHQYGVAMTVLSAALRLMRIDHRQGQAIFSAPGPTVPGDYAPNPEAVPSRQARVHP